MMKPLFSKYSTQIQSISSDSILVVTPLHPCGVRSVPVLIFYNHSAPKKRILSVWYKLLSTVLNLRNISRGSRMLSLHVA